MKFFIHTYFMITLVIAHTASIAQKPVVFNPKTLYQSETLIINQIAKNSFVHISYIQTNDFGKVPCNGLIVRNHGEAIVFDTPTNDKDATTLIRWVQENLNCKIKAIIPTHFHDDCLGGLKAFHEHNIASYAYYKTIELAKAKQLTVPKNSFQDSLNLQLGKEIIIAKFFGEGHTKDNVVGYFPNEKVLFGGCLIKELDATKGYLGDANVADWSATVKKLKKQYPQVNIVIPGHGEYGNSKLLDYTINLFKK